MSVKVHVLVVNFLTAEKSTSEGVFRCPSHKDDRSKDWKVRTRTFFFRTQSTCSLAKYMYLCQFSDHQVLDF